MVDYIDTAIARAAMCGWATDMIIFLSHATQDKPAAESIAFSLRGRGHKVFLDRDDLPPGESFDQQIERAVKRSDIFIFLISPDSVGERRYTLTELAFARRKWPSPHKRVLPVMTRETPLEQVPSYLKAVTILEPHGNLTAETSAAVHNIRARNPNLWLVAAGIGVLGVVAVIIAFSFFGKPQVGNTVTNSPGPSEQQRVTPPERPPQLTDLVEQLFSSQKKVRTDAYDAIVKTFGNDQNTVSLLLNYSTQHMNNFDGIFNAATTLRDISRTAIQPYKADINQFCDRAEQNGANTKARCDDLRRRLEQ